jgi:hypothetical protein
MKAFELTFQGMIIRFYLMMTIVITAGFTGVWAVALLALPIFVSGMIGLSFTEGKKATPTAELIGKQIELDVRRGMNQQAA